MNNKLFKCVKNSVFIIFFLMFHWAIRTEIGINSRVPELPIVIITSSYNNASWVIRYLDSIFMQEYDNFRLIYIDDCSNDGTANMVQAYANWLGIEEKVTLIKNDVRKLKLENIYKVIHGCNDLDIVLILDGDDWFAHEKVLANINKKYQEEDTWFVYGQVKFFDDGEVSIGKPIPAEFLANRNFRKLPWIFRHPITFYAWLFKLIRLKDLLGNEVPEFQGKFYPNCNDRAMIYPMLEMSQYHIGFIPEVAVIQNRFNPLSSQNVDNQQMGPTPTQIMCYKENTARSIQHSVLERPVTNRLASYVSAKADCLILSENNPIGLLNLLNASQQYVKGIGQYCVIYQADENNIHEAYKELQLHYSHLKFYRTPINRAELQSVFNALQQDHIILFSDKKRIDCTIDCNYAIYEMESTCAYTFDTAVSTQLLDNLGIPYQHIGNGLFAWKFLCDKGNSLKVHNLNGSIFRKDTIKDVFLNRSYKTIKELGIAWQSVSIDTNNVGLFVSIPSDKINRQ